MSLFVVLFCLFVCLSASSDCRFAKKYNISGVLNNNEVRSNFLNEYFYWEQQFVNTNGISLHPQLMTTYDASILDCTSGKQKSFHDFSAASKEALHLMFILHTINDANFKNISNSIDVVNTKLNSYDQFNQLYPGFGGYLPWFGYKEINNKYHIVPSTNWENKTPALDNGELYWCLYGLKWGLIQNYQTIVQNNDNLDINQTLNKIEKQLTLMEINAKRMFYTENGKFRGTVFIANTSLPTNDTAQNYSGNSGPGDPFEMELFQWLLVLKSKWTNDEIIQIWNISLQRLFATNYTIKSNNNDGNINITVQQGWHYSSHEQWKLLVLPYLDSDLMKTIFENVEKVRTINSDMNDMNGNEGVIPGMYASVNAPNHESNCSSYQFWYDAGAGIPSVACCPTDWYFGIITPYSTMTLWLFNESVAASWLLNMLQGNAMQNIYGSTESTFTNGTSVCPFVSWGAKQLTYNGAKGGIAKWTKYGLQMEGFYDTFINQMNVQYQTVFGNDINKIKTDQEFAIPKTSIPHLAGLSDFLNCN